MPNAGRVAPRQRIHRDIVQTCHHDVRSCGKQPGRVPQSGDAKRGHATSAGRLDTSGGVLDDEAPCRFNPQFRRSQQENLRVRFTVRQDATADIGGEHVEQAPAGPYLYRLHHLIGVFR